MNYDYIVVGGGTAGVVLAARLSEDRDRQVLLLEAGPDYPDEIPADLLDGTSPVTSGHNWDLQAIVNEDDTAPVSEPMGRVAKVFERAASRLASGQGGMKLGSGGAGRRFPYPMGKVVGGGSAINGSLALHARPEDYALWTVGGNDQWSWEKVQPFIRRIESAESEKPALPIEVLPPAGFTRVQGAFFDTCLEMGHPEADFRQGLAAGVGVIPMSVRAGRRTSTAWLYLTAARQRPNLTLQPRCLVDRILFESRDGVLTATGVEAIIGGQRQRFSGGHVVLAAGAIHSPAILMRSGVGAAEEIERAGGKPLLDLPGVGKNLMEHPAVSIWAAPRPGACSAGEPVHQIVLQQRSSTAGALCDLHLYMLSGLPTRKMPPLEEVVGGDVAIGISVVVATPISRGRVEILDGDPARSPRVYLNCAREPKDVRKLMEGLRTAWRLMQGEKLAATVDRIVLFNQSVIDSDALLERLIHSTVRGTWHPVGTLRMGAAGDAMAVVDQQGRLRGCGNVTVADGSIMPVLPSVPTNLTCMLIGERIAASLRGQENG